MHTSTVLHPQQRKMVTSKPQSVAENRREHLRLLMKQHDGPGALAAQLGYKNGSFLVQMAGPNPTRPVTEKTARAIEEKLGLPAGFMDTPAVENAPRTEVVQVTRGSIARPAGAPVPQVGADSPLVADVVRLVGQVAESENVPLPAVRFADLVALAWSDTLAHNGKPREEYVRQLVKLIK